VQFELDLIGDPADIVPAQRCGFIHAAKPCKRDTDPDVSRAGRDPGCAKLAVGGLGGIDVKHRFVIDLATLKA